jgi:DNA replication and repair protein RecF
MILKNISILNYKNIADAKLELSPKINCFIGSNGEGKTNVLDAVHYMSFCRSTTTNIDSSVIRHDTDFFMINAEYVTDSGAREELYAGMKRGTKKQFKRNKKAYKKLALKHHPDRVATLGEDVKKASEEKFKSIVAAYEKIKKERNIN